MPDGLGLNEHLRVAHFSLGFYSFSLHKAVKGVAVFVFDIFEVDGRDLISTDRLTDRLNVVDRKMVVTKPHHTMCV